MWQVMSLLLIIFGMFGKVGAALTTIPEPIIGGLLLIGLGKFTEYFKTQCELNDKGGHKLEIYRLSN